MAGRIETVLAVTISVAILAFGAVYPWGYWPLALISQAIGFFGLYFERRFDAGGSRALSVSLVALVIAGAVQLVPIPFDWLRTISPSAIPILAQLDPAVATGYATRHPISVHPAQTALGLSLLASFSLLCLGTSRLFSVNGVRRTVTALTVTGVLVSIVGLVQNSFHSEKIYGFWMPVDGPSSGFGPFVNRNHFAGCLLLLLPLAIGAVLQRFSRGVGASGFRERLLWLSSPAASKLVLFAGASALMSLALVVAMSRSGIGVLAVSLALTAVLAHSAGTTRTRWAMLAFVGGLVLLLLGYIGLQPIVQRFTPDGGSVLMNRWGPWSDAWRVATMFPVAGTGLNTYGTVMLFQQRYGNNVHFSAAHNDYLQLLAEGGLLMSIPAVAAILLFVRDVGRRLREDRGTSSYWLRAGALTSLIAIGLQEVVEFSLQIPANAALFAVVCGVALHKTPRRRTQKTEPGT